MNYEEFLSNLNRSGWKIEGKSYAFINLAEKWQLAFIRLGGRLQREGFVSFVICVRNLLNRNLDGEVLAFNKEPHSYPYKFTLERIKDRSFTYQCQLENFDLTYLEADSNWIEIMDILVNVIPSWLDSHSSKDLLNEIKSNGENGYIEKLWIEDLQNDA